MWKVIPINPSSAIVFNRMDAIISIARSMKCCHTFYLSKEDSCIYGCNEEFYNIHVLNIDQNIFNIPTSLLFKILSIDIPTVMKYKSFVMYREYPWLMLPYETINEHTSYRLVFNNDIWKVIDKNNNEVEFLNLISMDESRGIMGVKVNNIINIINGMKRIEPLLGERQYFGNQETNPLIQQVFASKASEGYRYFRLTGINGKNYGIALFKNLFNMNKNDNLTIIIRDRLDNINLFEGIFITKKKKSPLPDIIPNYEEYVYAMFINI